MKIGVFGDSYADYAHVGTSTPIWYNFLAQEHGHEIACWGEAGSSILFSADLIRQHAREYDLAIWCLTTPGRFSFKDNRGKKNVHVSSSQDRCSVIDYEAEKKHQACLDYLKYMFEWPTENFIGEAIVNLIQQQHDNVMIIPCFPPPLNAQFNLYHLCEWEAGFYFPGQTIPEIYQRYHDLRPGHIGAENQRILANLLSTELHPGVFQTTMDHFRPPTQPLEEMFEPL